MVGLATVLQGELKTAVEILALFHLSITTIPIQPLLAPQAEHNDFRDCIPALPAVKVKGRGISPAMNSGLSPPAAHSPSQSPMMSLLSFQLAGVHKSLLLKKILHSSVPSSTTEVK